MAAEKLVKREDVDKKFMWKIEDIYANDELLEKDMSYLESNYKQYEEYENKLGDSAEALAEFYKFDDMMSLMLEKVYVYSNQKLHENLGNTKYQSYASKAQSLMVMISTAQAYVAPELLSIPEEKLLLFIEENDEVKKHEKGIKDLLRKKKHVLDKDKEEILAMTEDISSAPSDIFALFNNVDIDFGKIKDEKGKGVELTHARYQKFMESEDRSVRKQAFMKMYKAYIAHKNTLGAIFTANLKQSAFYAKTRNYSSDIEMALDSSNVQLEVYDNLIKTVHERMNLMYRYVALRKKELKVDKLHMYDLYTPMVKAVKKQIPFEEAKQIVKKGLAPMGKEYIKVLEEGYNNGWIDVYENVGKRSGAYSWGVYGTHPYVLLNYQDNLNNVFTLAHEMGHAIHSYYSDKNQPYCSAGYKIFVAEVASTCNESLLIHYLLKKSKDVDEKKYLINYFLEQFKGTLYRQTMFAEFERITHKKQEEGEGLTSDELCDIYYKLNKKYFGKNITIDKQISYEWSRIPHFYNPFYVYQYATGFSAAIALSTNILKNGEKAVEDYMKFLTGGGSKDPIDLLMLAGVDMTTSEPITKALDVFEDLLNQYESL